MKSEYDKKITKIVKESIKNGKKRLKQIKKFKKYNFSEEMINDLNNYFTRRHGMVEFYLPYPMGHGVEGTELYQIFKKYNKEKLLKGHLFAKANIDFPLIWNIKEDTYRIYLGESMEEIRD